MLFFEWSAALHFSARKKRVFPGCTVSLSVLSLYPVFFVRVAVEPDNWQESTVTARHATGRKAGLGASSGWGLRAPRWCWDTGGLFLYVSLSLFAFFPSLRPISARGQMGRNSVPNCKSEAVTGKNQNGGFWVVIFSVIPPPSPVPFALPLVSLCLMPELLFAALMWTVSERPDSH